MKILRGLTAPCLWFDEFAFLKFNDTIYESAIFAYSEAAKSAASFNKPYGRLITTTPNDLDVPSGLYAHSFKEDAAPFKDELYDFSPEDLAEYIEKNSSNDFLYAEYQYYDLRRDKKWLKSQIRHIGRNRAKIKREIYLEWPSTNDLSLFTEEEIDILESYKKAEELKKSFMKFYDIYFYKEVDPMQNYIASVDVAGGLGRDCSSIVVSDPRDDDTIAVFNNNTIDTDELPKMLKEVSIAFPNFYFLIERNSYGLTVIQKLIKDPIVASKLIEITKIEKKNNKRTISKVVGIDTSVSSRPLIIEGIEKYITEKPEVMGAPLIISQAKTLQRDKKGKIQHAPHAKDDVLMAKGFYIYLKLHCYHDLKKLIKKETIDKEDSTFAHISRLGNKVETKTPSISDNLMNKAIQSRMHKVALSKNKKTAAIANILKYNR